ncbi:MAG: integrase core domain-containing protein [Gammaproteobacteria bacterium]
MNDRFHQTLKHEEVYWKHYQSPAEARGSLERFRRRYNQVRPHWVLVPEGGGDVLTPADLQRLPPIVNMMSQCVRKV